MEKKIRMVDINDLRTKITEYELLIKRTEEVIAEILKYSNDDHPHLIPDSEFEKYVRYMIMDLFEIDSSVVVIDWEKTTKLVKETYNYIDYNDETYWYR